MLKCSPVRILVAEMNFKCQDCHRNICKRFVQGIYCPPIKCSTQNCKGRQFTPEKVVSKYILYQRVRIQEIEEGEQVSGRVPRCLECEIKEHLVGTVKSGDIIILNGILRTESTMDNAKGAGGQGKKAQGIYTNYLDVNSMTNNKNDNKAIGEKEEEDDELIQESDYQLIQNLSELPNIFPLLVKSLCPTIYGHELLKAGILLAILGGTASGFMPSHPLQLVLRPSSANPTLLCRAARPATPL